MIEIVKCVMLVFLIVALIAFMIMAGVSLLVLEEVVTKDEARRWLRRKEKKAAEPTCARWVAETERTGNYSHCSECGCRCRGYLPNYKYCPNCGAKMDLESSDGLETD